MLSTVKLLLINTFNSDVFINGELLCLSLARLVREFYTNLHTSVLDPNSSWFHKIYIHGQLLKLSPALIRNLFELPDNNITSSLTYLHQTKAYC